MTVKRASIIFLVAVLIVTVSGGLWALNSVRFTSWLVKKIVARDFPQVAVEEIQISTQKFRFPNELDFKKIQASVKQGNIRYRIEVKRLLAQGLLTLWRPKNDISLDLEGLEISSDVIGIKDLSANIHAEVISGQLKGLTGSVQVKQGRFGVYEMTDGACLLGRLEHGLILKDLTAQAYGAKLNGEISLEYPLPLSYSVQMIFDDLDVSRLKAINDVLPTQVEGVFSGSLQIAGRETDISDIDLNTSVVRDGRIRASLLSFVTQYMPSSKEREYLDKALKSNGKVNVQKGSIELKSISKDKLTALVKLFCKELNLDQNFVIDINSDGKLTTLLDYLDQFSIQ